MIDSSQRRNLLVCLCLTAAIVVVYWPVRRFEFTNYDDDDYVSENSHVQSGLTLQAVAWAFTTNHAANWHPLTWLSHMLDWQLWKGNAGAHHLVNVLFHIANTLLLFGVLRRMTAAPWRSAFVAALFALHPLHVESVAWVAERKDLLSALFWMLTMWAYVRYVETFNIHRSSLHAPVSAEVKPSGTKAERFTLHALYALALLFFTLGLMAKAMLVTLPFVLLLLDFWPLGRTQWAKPATGENVKASPSQLLKEKLPFVALTIASCVVTYWTQRHAGAVASLVSLPLAMRIANALLSYVGYVAKTAWPVGLAVLYPRRPGLPTPAVMAAGVGLLAMTAVVVGRARREPWLATGWFWYLGTLVPVIGLVQVGYQSMADRYTYVPLIGLFLMLGWSVSDSVTERWRSRMIIGVGAGAVLAVCAVLSGIQIRYWKNSETLSRHALNVTRNNWIAHNNLGLALAGASRVEEAIDHFEQALRINPDYAEADSNLGAALGEEGKVREAIEHLQQAVRMKPDFAEAHYNLGVALGQVGRVQEAIEHFEQALRSRPDSAALHYNLGVALAQLGRIQEATGHLEQALRIRPDYTEAQNRLARLRATQ